MNVNQLVIVAVFGIVFIVSCVALKKAGLFNHPARVAISACVAALCIISLFDVSSELALHNDSPSGSTVRLLENDAAKSDQTLRKVILIPYLAFLLSLPVLLLLWLWAKLFPTKWPDMLCRNNNKPHQSAEFLKYGNSGATIMKDGKLYHDDSR